MAADGHLGGGRTPASGTVPAIGPLGCFKAYDIRGRVPGELNEDVAWRVGRAVADQLAPAEAVVGRDVRPSGEGLAAALTRGLNEGGVRVVDIGRCGTEEVYFAAADLKAGAGVMVTASHNPADYNGMKLVRAGARPVSGDTGLAEIRARAEAGRFGRPQAPGAAVRRDVRPAYIERLLGCVDPSALKPLRIVCDAGNGGAGEVVDRLEPRLPFRFVKLRHAPDGSFPSGVPNPLLEENRAPTAEAVRESGADLGIAWDGDFDRCFFFDETGRFIEGYYMVGLLARAFLEKSPGERIVHDPRLVWNTRRVVAAAGGEAVQSRSGHAFLKEAMRASDAVYGGEMSAHHYFRDFHYCDSGMIPWLLVAELMSRSGLPLSAMVDESMAAFPASGEINSAVADPAALLREAERRYGGGALAVDRVDGLSVEHADWRFNLRASNTEPVVRLNVESRGDAALMREKTAELLALVRA